MNAFLSKKLGAFLVYVAVVVLNKVLDLGLVESDVYALTGATGAYTIGQGIADTGKERAAVEKAADYFGADAKSLKGR